VSGVQPCALPIPSTSSPRPRGAGREPLWHPELAPPPIVGLDPDKREVLVTYLLDGEPDHRYPMPGPSLWPFLTALATSFMFIWSIFQAQGVAWGAIPLFITLVGWFWPTAAKKQREHGVRGQLTAKESVS